MQRPHEWRTVDLNSPLSREPNLLVLIGVSVPMQSVVKLFPSSL